mgnify:CR=1 FL=1
MRSFGFFSAKIRNSSVKRLGFLLDNIRVYPPKSTDCFAVVRVYSKHIDPGFFFSEDKLDFLRKNQGFDHTGKWF